MNLEIKVASTQDAEYTKLVSEIKSSEVNLNETYFKVDQNGLIWFKERLYMPKNLEIKLFILNEIHKMPFAGHPRY